MESHFWNQKRQVLPTTLEASLGLKYQWHGIKEKILPIFVQFYANKSLVTLIMVVYGQGFSKSERPGPDSYSPHWLPLWAVCNKLRGWLMSPTHTYCTKDKLAKKNARPGLGRKRCGQLHLYRNDRRCLFLL